MTWLLLFRALERGTIGAVSTTLALTLAVEGGLTSFTSFLAMTAAGGVIGSAWTYVASHRASPMRPVPLLWLQAATLPMVAATPLLTTTLLPLGVAGMTLSLVSAPVNAITHTEASRASNGMRTRARITAATALGGAAGAALAGTVVDRTAFGITIALSGLLAITVPLVGRRFHPPPLDATATTAPDPSGHAVDSPSHRDVFSVAWRLALIANLAFAPALVAPGLVTQTSGAAAGGFASAGYQIGAVLTVPTLAVLDRALRGAATRAFSQGAAAFGIAAVTIPLWLGVTGPAEVAVAICLVMGIVLFLLQTGFEQRGANLAAHLYAGPTVAILHGVLALSGLGSVLLYPPLINWVGLPAVLLASSCALAVLGGVEARRRYRRHQTAEGLVTSPSTRSNTDRA